MGFFSKLKKVVSYVEKGTVLARKGAAVAEQAQTNPLGAALAAVEVIQEAKSGMGASVAFLNGAAHVDTVKAVAVAVDDHESRMAALEKAVAAIQDWEGMKK